MKTTSKLLLGDMKTGTPNTRPRGNPERTPRLGGAGVGKVTAPMLRPYTHVGAAPRFCHSPGLLSPV